MQTGTLELGQFLTKNWLYAKWEKDYIDRYQPSIEYLELYVVTASLLTWGELITNKRIVIFCDNQVVVSMINNLTSSYKNCMYLLCLIVLDNLINNRKIYVKYVRSAENDLSDALSRLQFKRFWRIIKSLGRQMSKNPTPLWSKILLASSIWLR